MTKPISIVFLVILFASTLTAQQVIRGQSKPASERAGTAAGALTFDTLLSEDSYEFYGKVRNIGQLVGAGGDFLEPLAKFGAGPKELKQNGIIRGDDHQGGPATIDDKPIQ